MNDTAIAILHDDDDDTAAAMWLHTRMAMEIAEQAVLAAASPTTQLIWRYGP